MTAPADWYPDPSGEPGRVRWWDGAQWTENTFLRASGQWTPAGGSAVPAKEYRPTARLGRWAVGIVLLVAALQGAVAFSVDPSFESVQQAAYADSDLDSLVTAYDVLNMACAAGLLAAWLVNAAWLARARTNAEALAPGSPHTRGAGWAWGSWVCPVVGLWFPYQLVRDVSRATRAGGRALIGLWWAAFLAMVIFDRVVSSASRSMAESAGTWDDFVTTIRDLEFAAFVITAIAAVAWVVVVRRIERDQVEASAAVAVGR